MIPMTHLSDIPAAVKGLPRKRMAVAYGEDAHTLQAVQRAVREGIVDAVVVGSATKIAEVASASDVDTSLFEIMDVQGELPSVKAAVKLVRDGSAHMLMKGLAHTDNYMRGILNKETGLLPEGGLLSHVAVFEAPSYPRLIIVSDVAVVPLPSLQDKVRITKLTIGVARSLRIDVPKVAFLSASESVLKFASSQEAAILAGMAVRKQFGAIVAEGPISIDCALFPDACQVKSFTGRIQGDADVIIVPNIESGNVFYKVLCRFGGGEVAAMVTGTTAPCILTSRGDSEDSKFYSIALGALNA
ncbi:MAG: phosphate acyltransferase [Candidatus Cryosericum sp.]